MCVGASSPPWRRRYPNHERVWIYSFRRPRALASAIDPQLGRRGAAAWVRGTGDIRPTPPLSARRASGAWPSASSSVVVLDLASGRPICRHCQCALSSRVHQVPTPQRPDQPRKVFPMPNPNDDTRIPDGQAPDARRAEGVGLGEFPSARTQAAARGLPQLVGTIADARRARSTRVILDPFMIWIAVDAMGGDERRRTSWTVRLPRRHFDSGATLVGPASVGKAALHPAPTCTASAS